MTAADRVMAAIVTMSDEDRDRVRRMLDGDEGTAGSQVPRRPRNPYRQLEAVDAISWSESMIARHKQHSYVIPLLPVDRWPEPITEVPIRYVPGMPDRAIMVCPSFGPPVVMS